LGVKCQKEKYFQSIKLIQKSGIEYEFRTTLIKNYHSLENFSQVLKQISGAKKYFLQNYRSGNTLNPVFAGKSFCTEELLAFRNLAIQYIPNTFIRL
jgi:pyruvate formate lyase activating enzyme